MSDKAKRYKKLWRYSTKLKEGGKAWDRVMTEMEQLYKEIMEERANRNEQIY